MAIPTMSDLAGLDYALMGRTFYDGGSKSTVDMTGLDYACMGECFVGNAAAASGVTVTLRRALMGCGV